MTKSNRTMDVYIVIANNKLNGELKTSKPFFSHTEAEEEMWRMYGNVFNETVEEIKKYVDRYQKENGDRFLSTTDNCINNNVCKVEIHPIRFNEEDIVKLKAKK